MNKILVWDAPVRIGHWLLVGAFALAWITGDSEEWRLMHAFAGGTGVGVILFRLLWGFIGSPPARFVSFLRSPAAAYAYLKALAAGRPPHFSGHNPAGALAIVALLALGLMSGFSGWLTYNDLGSELSTEAHETLVHAMLFVVCLHLAGVIVSSLAHRENLIRAMISGYKQGAEEDAIAKNHAPAVPLLLCWAAACAWWMSR